jgi:outer membrane protein
MSELHRVPTMHSSAAMAVLLGLCLGLPALGQPSPVPPAAPRAALQEPGPELQAPPLPTGAPSRVPTDRAITLKEAIAVALYVQPQVALAEYTAAAARERVREAASGLYPTLSVSGQHTRTGPSRGGGVSAVGGQFTAGGYTTNLSARELIWDFGKTPAAVGQAAGQAESARQALAQTRQDVINQVKQAYYTLLQDQELLGVQQQNVADQRAHLDLARGRFQVGVAPRSDVVTAEAAVANALLNLATAQNAVAAARVNLNIALGIDVRTPTRVEQAQEVGPPLPEPVKLVEQAFSNRPVVSQSRADVEAARNALRAARATDLPGLYLNWNYGLSGDTFPPENASWAYGVSMSWPLLDVGLTKGRIREAEANLLAAQTQLHQTEQTVSSQVVQAYLNVQTARQKVSAAEAEVASAEEQLRLATGRYETGVAAYIEVTDAETAALTARTNLVNARFGESTSLAALESALGVVEGE